MKIIMMLYIILYYIYTYQAHSPVQNNPTDLKSSMMAVAAALRPKTPDTVAPCTELVSDSHGLELMVLVHHYTYT